MKTMVSSDNTNLLTDKQQSTFDLQNIFVIKSEYFPSYLFNRFNRQQSINQTSKRIPNLNPGIVNQIAEKLGLRFASEPFGEVQDKNASPVCYANSDEVSDDFKIEILPLTFAPIDILDYIYAVLHSLMYREKYKEFLKIDFPGVPYPKNQRIFWALVKSGGELRQIHLLECPVVEKYITQYPINGNNKVVKINFENNKVFINDTQYFDNVPTAAWDFYIGGYRPAQKWLKDRKGKELSFDDILHYQKIIVALKETDRIMKEIDQIAIE